MAASNPLDILLQHDRWATHQIIDACKKLTPEQFSQRFEMGPGSLQATITHMIGAINAWCDTLARRALRPRIEHSGIAYSPEELLGLNDQSHDELDQLAKSHPVEEMVTRMLKEKEYLLTRGAVVTHVTTHGMHHRAQCLNMLRHLGVKPLPMSSVHEWFRTVEMPQ